MDTTGEESKDVDPSIGSSQSNLASISSPKKPPPERPEDVRLRGFVIGSFWVVVLFFGLPVWWWTTSIHRARLPLREMLEWADGKVSFHPMSC